MNNYINFLSQAYTYKHEWWRYLLFILPFIPVIFLLYQGLCLLITLILGEGAEFYNALYYSVLDDTPSVYVMSRLLVHVITFITVIMLFLLVHRGRAIQLINSGSKVRWNRMFCAVGLVIVCYALQIAISFAIDPDTSGMEFVFKAKEFFPYLALLLILLPFQVSFEEIMLRSYLNQSLALLCKYPLINFVVSSAIFAALHYGDLQMAESYAVLMLSMFLFGIFMCIIMLLDDGIELCIGIHFISNLIAFSFVEREEGMPALFRINEEMSVLGYENVLCEVCLYAVLLFIFTKIYHWDWRRLLQKIEKPVVEKQGELN